MMEFFEVRQLWALIGGFGQFPTLFDIFGNSDTLILLDSFEYFWALWALRLPKSAQSAQKCSKVPKSAQSAKKCKKVSRASKSAQNGQKVTRMAKKCLELPNLEKILSWSFFGTLCRIMVWYGILQYKALTELVILIKHKLWWWTSCFQNDCETIHCSSFGNPHRPD